MTDGGYSEPDRHRSRLSFAIPSKEQLEAVLKPRALSDGCAVNALQLDLSPFGGLGRSHTNRHLEKLQARVQKSLGNEVSLESKN